VVQDLLLSGFGIFLYTFGRTPWTGDRPVARLYLHRTTKTQK
jgi:hypothetical protein